MDRLGARLQLSQADVLREIGLAEPRKSGILAFAGIGLPAPKIEALATRLALDPEEVRQSLLTRYDGVAFDLPPTESYDSRWRQSVAMKEWVYVIGSVCCPLCLASDEPTAAARGVWRIAWKLPWSFVCTRHARLLLDRCPACELQVRSGAGNDLGRARAATVPEPERCANQRHPESSGGLRETCGELLSALKTAPVRRGSRVLQAQAIVDAALAGEAPVVGGVELRPIDFFGDLRSLSSLILRDGTLEQLGKPPGFAHDRFEAWIEERSVTYRARDEALTGGRRAPRVRAYGKVPRDTALMAAVVPAALEVLEEPTTDAMALRLEELVDSAQRRNKHTVRNVLADYRISAPLREALESCLARRGPLPTRFRRNRSGTAASVSVDEIPQLFWEDLYELHLAALFSRGWETQARRFCSIAFAHAVGAATVADAVAALELPPSTVSTAYEWRRRLAAEGKLDEFQTAVESLLPVVGARDRPNLAERRRKLEDFAEIPEDEWSNLCAEAGLGVGRQINRRYAAAWLWAEMTGGDYRLAPAVASLVSEGRAASTVNERVRSFARSARGESLAPVLRRFGQTQLAAAGSRARLTS